MSYSPIRPTTLRANVTLTFDVYLSVGEKYILYIKNGDHLDQHQMEKIEKLKDQKVDRVFIADAQFDDYEKFISKLLESAKAIPSEMPVDEKVEIIEESTLTAMESLEKNPDSKVAYKMTEKAANSLRFIVAKNPSALKKIFGRKAVGNELVMKHCFNVCAFACEYAEMLGFEDKDLDNLGTAALVHDLSITQFKLDDRNLFKKKIELFSTDEKRFYKEHAEKSVSMLKSKPYVNKDVLQLVLKHEEKISGQGLNGDKDMTKLQQILSLVNIYDKKVTVYGMEHVEALQEVFETEVGNYELEYLKKLKTFAEAKGLI